MTGKPLHIAIIPDGNRRWAQMKGMHPWQGHEKTIENFRKVTEFCRNHPRISVLTVWCFSTENWKRDPKEIAVLMRLFETYLNRERETWQKKGTRFVHSGRKDRIPKSLATLIEEVEHEPLKNPAFTLHIALDYGGRDEIIRAAQKCEGDITEETLRRHLDHPELPGIDLIIRTSGEIRTSNFFLWQSAYAEWMFLGKHFPDFSVDDIEGAVKEFDRRQRRFGT